MYLELLSVLYSSDAAAIYVPASSALIATRLLFLEGTIALTSKEKKKFLLHQLHRPELVLQCNIASVKVILGKFTRWLRLIVRRLHPDKDNHSSGSESDVSDCSTDTSTSLSDSELGEFTERVLHAVG